MAVCVVLPCACRWRAKRSSRASADGQAAPAAVAVNGPAVAPAAVSQGLRWTRQWTRAGYTTGKFLLKTFEGPVPAGGWYRAFER